MYKLFFISMALVLSLGKVFGQSSWELKTQKNGIAVYTTNVPDSKIKAIKVECEMKATPSQLVALLMDVNTSASWLYHTKSSELIKQVSPSELYYYSEVSLPWPAANRDFVGHLIVSQNPVTKVVVIDGPIAPNLVPIKKGIVRVTVSKGQWVITPYGYNTVKVSYILHTDPAGNLPAWMVNMFATQGPVQIFEGIKQQIQKPAYKNAEFSFIENKQYASN